MHVQEKQAWFILAVFCVTLFLYLLVVSLIGYQVAAFGALGFMGLAGGAGFIGERERRKGKVVMDERDIKIGKEATLAGLFTFWGMCVIASLAPLILRGPGAVIAIPVGALPVALGLGATVLFVVRSLVIVILYRRGSRADG